MIANAALKKAENKFLKNIRWKRIFSWKKNQLAKMNL
jgi:hypothetical protein